MYKDFLDIKPEVAKAMEEGVPVVVGSDAHFYTGIGDFSHAQALLEEVDFPAELVLNTDPEKFLGYLKKR